MIACLQKIDSTFANQVYKAVFLGESARPGAGRKVLQWLRLAHSREGISQNSLNQIEGAKGNLAVRFHPVLQILDELRMKYGHPLAGRG